MNIKQEYFEWMIKKIFHKSTVANDYIGLLLYFNNIPFVWEFDTDENRQKDAQDLRYIFGEEYGYCEALICQELDIYPPTLFEVIVALINRGQENILYDPEQVDLNQDIFLDMLKSLNLYEIRGNILTSHNINLINQTIQNLFYHNYSYYGEGGLFTVNNPKQDMRDTEIWYQFMWYLDEKLGGKYL